MKYYLLFDVGGTMVKCNVFDEGGVPYLGESMAFLANSSTEKEDILNGFILMIESLVNSVNEAQKIIAGIGFAFPGPFDYENGVCLVRKLSKYEALYGSNLKTEIKRRLKNSSVYSFFVPDYTIIFENDAVLFALGEAKFGHGRGHQRVACFTLGTGCGSTFIKDGKIVKGEEGIPVKGMIYDQSFEEGIIDDYISARGLRRIADKYLLEYYSGKELFEMALNGDRDVQKVFYEFGENSGRALGKFIYDFQADIVIFGGQISKSYDFFKEGLAKGLSQSIEVKISKDTPVSTMYGLYVFLNERDRSK